MPSTSVPSVLAKFHHHFRGELRAQLKPLAHVLGIGENTIRNNSNVIRIDGQDVRPVKINGRWTYDLAEIAEALTSAHARASDHGAPAEIAANPSLSLPP